MRWLPGIDVDRARLRSTLVWQFDDSFSAGLEWNPLADDIGPVANWRFVDESESLPALMLGTSSDRIGTPEGRSVYLTAAKSLDAWTGLPLAPYAGVAWGEYEDEFRFIGGLSVSWNEDWHSLHLWDGVNVHSVVERSFGEHSLGLVLAQQDDEWFLGATWSFSFAPPWSAGAR